MVVTSSRPFLFPVVIAFFEITSNFPCAVAFIPASIPASNSSRLLI